MHSLQCLLVKIWNKKNDKQISVDDLRCYAKYDALSALKDFVPNKIDYINDTDVKVVLGTEPGFLQEFENRWQTPYLFAVSSFKNLNTLLSNDNDTDQSFNAYKLLDLLSSDNFTPEYWVDMHINIETLFWCLSEICKALYGLYEAEFGFYSVINGSSKISRRTLDDVRKNPDNYALVYVDVHM